MSEVCRVEYDTNVYYTELELLESNAAQIEAEREEKISNLVDDMMGGEDSEPVIEIVANEEDCWSAIMDLCLPTCDQPLSELPLRDIQTLAAAAYKLNNSIAKHARRYVDAPA
tara:strand:- start:10145 stop:10483 length:339 start_codon:yes stop_codon:yes gene_type:complete